jgi:hypothetical protein
MACVIAYVVLVGDRQRNGYWLVAVEMLAGGSLALLLMYLEQHLSWGSQGGQAACRESTTSVPSFSSEFPRLWELFPVILPRSVRERVYEPSHEELKEDYLKYRAMCRGAWSRRWVTFSFTIRTGGLIAQSLWAAAGGKARQLTLAAIVLFFGERLVAVAREKLAEWLGRLP